MGTLTPFTRNRVYFLFDPNIYGISNKLGRVDTVTIFAPTPFRSFKKIDIPITVLAKKEDTIHKLAARSLLADLESGDSPIHLDSSKRHFRSKDIAKLVRAEAEAIACRWSLVSKWTSFLLIEEPYQPRGDDPFMDIGIIDVRDTPGDDLLRPRGQNAARLLTGDAFGALEAGVISSSASNSSANQVVPPRRHEIDTDIAARFSGLALLGNNGRVEQEIVVHVPKRAIEGTGVLSRKPSGTPITLRPRSVGPKDIDHAIRKLESRPSPPSYYGVPADGSHRPPTSDTEVQKRRRSESRRMSAARDVGARRHVLPRPPDDGISSSSEHPYPQHAPLSYTGPRPNQLPVDGYPTQHHHTPSNQSHSGETDVPLPPEATAPGTTSPDFTPVVERVPHKSGSRPSPASYYGVPADESIRRPAFVSQSIYSPLYYDGPHRNQSSGYGYPAYPYPTRPYQQYMYGAAPPPPPEVAAPDATPSDPSPMVEQQGINPPQTSDESIAYRRPDDLAAGRPELRGEPTSARYASQAASVSQKPLEAAHASATLGVGYDFDAESEASGFRERLSIPVYGAADGNDSKRDSQHDGEGDDLYLESLPEIRERRTPSLARYASQAGSGSRKPLEASHALATSGVGYDFDAAFYDQVDPKTERRRLRARFSRARHRAVDENDSKSDGTPFGEGDDLQPEPPSEMRRRKVHFSGHRTGSPSGDTYPSDEGRGEATAVSNYRGDENDNATAGWSGLPTPRRVNSSRSRRAPIEEQSAAPEVEDTPSFVARRRLSKMDDAAYPPAPLGRLEPLYYAPDHSQAHSPFGPPVPSSPPDTRPTTALSPISHHPDYRLAEHSVPDIQSHAELAVNELCIGDGDDFKPPSKEVKLSRSSTRVHFGAGVKSDAIKFIRGLISHQRSNGSFEFENKARAEMCLGKAVVSKVRSLRKVLGWNETRTYTGIVVVLLGRDFKGYRSYWDLAEAKAVTYLTSAARWGDELGLDGEAYQQALRKIREALVGTEVPGFGAADQAGANAADGSEAGGASRESSSDGESETETGRRELVTSAPLG